MTVKLRRPARGVGRPAYATGGVVVQPPSAAPTDPGSVPEQQRARQALQNAGQDRPSPEQLAHVTQAAVRDRDLGRSSHTGDAGPAVARALQMGGSTSSGIPHPEPSSAGSRSIPPSVLAALQHPVGFAHGGVVGLPAPMFRPAALPQIATPGLASPHGLIAARHRSHFADGGLTLPPQVAAALALRPHFDDGGDVGGFDGFGNGGDGGVPASAMTWGFGDDGAQQGAIADPSASPQVGGQAQPTITASLPAQALPSASRDPSGLLQNGTDTTALDNFWAGKANAMPSPQWSNTHAGLAPNGGPVDSGSAASASDTATSEPAAATTAQPAHTATPLYNPMADDKVRASLHLATGGVARSALPPAILAALAADPHRLHFEDGGGAGGGEGGGGSGGGDSSHSSGGGSSSGGEGGSSGGGSSSGGEGGGEGGGSSSSSGGDNSNSSSSNSNSSSSGGHSDASTGGGGSGDGGSEGSSSGGGGGFSSGAASGSDSSSSGGRSDASSSGGYGGGSSSSDASSSGGGFSSGAASGADTGGMGGVAGGYGSATSGNVGSIGGSVGAPAAGGFSGAGEAATGGFGSFGPGPAANSNPAGLSGGNYTASSISGQTAQQSMASEASTGGDPGEDGTGSGLSGVTTAGAFGSFGPSPASPYGSTANAQGAFSGTQASDLSGAAGLSPMGQQLGMMGLGSMPSGEMANPNGFASPGAYGLSTAAAGVTPGFDNFNSKGDVQQSSLGDTGYTGYGGASLDPAASYSTTSGVMSGAMVGALQGGLPDPEARATDLDDLSKSFNPDYSGFTLGPDGKPSFAGNAGALSGLGGILGGAPFSGPVSTNATGSTPGLNADGDPTAVAGTSALTIHGNQTEAAQGGYDAPGPATTYGGITDKQAFDARQNIVKGVGTAADHAIASGYVAQQNSPVGRTVGLGLGAAPAAAAAAVSGAPAGLGPSPDAGGSPGITPGGSSDGATNGPAAGLNDAHSDPASQPGQPPSLTVSRVPGLPDGSYFAGLHRIEGGELNHTVDPGNPSHYGPAQFSQPTFSGVARNHPELGISPNMSMFDATEAQYSAITKALTQDDADALKNAGLPATPANLYMVHNLGAPVGIRAIAAGPDASLAQAGIPGSYVKSNPSIYGGLQTIGQVQQRVAGMMEKGATGASTDTASGIHASVQQALQHGPANYSPGAASGMDTTDTAAPSMNPGISPPSTWSPGVATPATTQTVSTPAPYGVTPTTSATLNAFGMSPTPANALAGETLGFGVAAQVMNGPPNDPVESAGISAATIAANPSLFAGVKTVGDLQANIAKAAETAGTTTSTVTTPGQPAQPGALPGYSYSPGVASGLDSVDPAAASFGISPPSTYTAPTGAPATPAKNAPEASAPDTAAPSHLSVPTGVTNTVAGIGLGALGPIGAGIAGVNAISGLLGGPTIGSALNGILANGGGTAASPLGGQGDNSNQPSQNAAPQTTGYGTTGYGQAGADTSAPSTASTSSSVSPFDPHASAMAAYEAAMAGMGRSTSGVSGASTVSAAPSAGDYDGTARPLVIHRGHPGNLPVPAYNPMQDPSVLRALGLD